MTKGETLTFKEGTAEYADLHAFFVGHRGGRSIHQATTSGSGN